MIHSRYKYLQQFLIILLFSSTFFLTSLSVAFAAPGGNIQGYIETAINFINGILIPFIFSLAILFFFVNIVRYYILNGADTYSHEQARKYLLYSIIAFVVILGIWGILQILMKSLGIRDTDYLCPDYFSYDECYNSGWGDDAFGEFGSTSISPNGPQNNSGFSTSRYGEFEN